MHSSQGCDERCDQSGSFDAVVKAGSGRVGDGREIKARIMGVSPGPMKEQDMLTRSIRSWRSPRTQEPNAVARMPRGTQSKWLQQEMEF